MTQHNSRRIKVLRDSVAKRIAAGEVIDRPFSVIRELLDNSIDAGATEIIISISQGGIKHIRCIDNGSGMSKEDLELCFLPHATSKIDEVDDLYSLHTLGFRGEALSSISACARLSITSKERNSETAHTLAINNGKLVSLQPDKGSNGTIVDVRDLFYSIPARLQFMKRESTETKACKDMLIEKSLAFPDISFKLFIADSLKLFLPASGKLERVQLALKNVFNPSFTYKTEREFNDLKVQIILSGPAVYRKDRRQIHIFINNRKISEFALVQAVEYGYTGFLPGGCFPIACVFITIQPELIDFNIHPAKREVKFKNLQDVHRAVVRTIQDFLNSKIREITNVPNPVANEQSFNFTPDHQQTKNPYSFSETSNHTVHSTKQAGIYSGKQHTPPGTAQKTNLARFVAENKTNFIQQDTSGHSEITYYGQIFNVFLLSCFNGKFYFVDQHAAHERILFDQYCADKKQFQEMLVPEIIQVDASVDTKLTEYQKELELFGIKIGKIKTGTWQLTAIHSALSDSMDSIIELLQNGNIDSRKLNQEYFADFACKAAIKDGDTIDRHTAESLLHQVFALENPRCPHGRPVWFTLTKEELFRFVGRVI